MRLIILLSLMAISPMLWAKRVNPLLKCLALEEDKFHKAKIQNARSRLNLELINEMAQTSELEVKTEFLNIICDKQEISPSEKFLELQLLHGINLYHLGSTNREHSMRLAIAGEFQKQLPQVFIKYLSSIQSELEKPNCLENSIPEIKKINEKIKYLEEDFSAGTLKTLHPEIKKIFSGIKNQTDLKAKCRTSKK